MNKSLYSVLFYATMATLFFSAVIVGVWAFDTAYTYAGKNFLLTVSSMTLLWIWIFKPNLVLKGYRK